MSGLREAEASVGAREFEAPALEVDAGLLESLAAYARAQAPAEACGLLLGRCAGRAASLEHASRSTNLARDPRRAFRIDPGAVVRSERDAACAGLELLGVWHSHPGGERVLSTSDRAAAWPGHVQLLLALEPAGSVSFAAWLERDGSWIELRIDAATSKMRARPRSSPNSACVPPSDSSSTWLPSLTPSTSARRPRAAASPSRR